jgi:hypothetical protein
MSSSAVAGTVVALVVVVALALAVLAVVALVVRGREGRIEVC